MKENILIYLLLISFSCLLSKHELQGQGCFPQDKLPSYITSLTDFGQRAEWSNNGKQVYFVDKAGGEVWVVNIKTRKVRQITKAEDRPLGHGYYRVNCLANGDLLLCCGTERHRLYFQVLDKRFKNPPKTIEGGGWDEGGEGCDEGPAVSRTSMKIAWTEPGQLQIYVGEIAYSNGQPKIINKKLVVDYKNIVTVDGLKYENSIESQDWRPKNEQDLIFAMYNTVWRTVERNKPTVSVPRKPRTSDKEVSEILGGNSGGCEVFGINLITGEIINYSKDPVAYDEPEGIFPDGEYTLMESNKHKPSGGIRIIEVYKLKLDGTGKNYERLTYFTDVEGFRASNPVVSDNGRYIAFQGSQARSAAGAGCGLYLFNIKQFEKSK